MRARRMRWLAAVLLFAFGIQAHPDPVAAYLSAQNPAALREAAERDTHALVRARAGRALLATSAETHWHPMPDAAFGVFLDTGSLQDFMAELPVPARETLRKQVEPVASGEGRVVAFLGTSAVPAGLRIDRIDVDADRLTVHLALHREEADSESVSSPHYPLATARLRRLPRPPFDVRFLDERGQTVATIRGVRPLLVPREDPDTTGDPWGVVRQLDRKVILRCGRDCLTPPGPGAVVGRGRNLVRIHDTRFSLFYTQFDTNGGGTLWLGGSLPDWMRLARSRCLLTDRSPEEIAEARAYDVWTRPEDVLTLDGMHRVALGDNPPMTAGRRLPKRAWLACDWSLSSQGFVEQNVRGLGTWVIDFYPAELHFRKPGTLEIVQVMEAYHDLTLKFRLFPPFFPDRGRNVPMRLFIHDPQPVPGTNPPRWLGAILYYGFERDPNRGVYGVYHGKDDAGDWYTWLTVQDPGEAFEYALQARLALCEAPREKGVLGDDTCNTLSAVQAFYTHAWFLGSYRLKPPVRLRLSLVSSWGYRSRPFEVVLGDEPDTPWSPCPDSEQNRQSRK